MSDFKKDHFSPVGLLMYNYMFEVDEPRKVKVKKTGREVMVGSNKYSVTLRLYGDDAQTMISKINSFIPEAKDMLGEDEISKMPYSQATDKEGVDIEGAFDFTLKTKNAPVVVNAKRDRISKDNIPGYEKGFTVGKGAVGFRPGAYPKPMGPGINLYLQSAQITESMTSGADISGFAEIDDGFVGELSSPEEKFQEIVDDLPDFASQ